MERSRPDYYRVLQVDPTANPLVIQAAYRVLAQIFHPDVSGDESEMKRINAAWEVLGDPRRRKQYDIELAGRHPGALNQHAPATAGAADSSAARKGSGSGNASAWGAAHRASQTGPAAPAAAAPATDGATAAPARDRRPDDHAGPPPGRPFGPVLRFGRYDGWSLGEIAGVDRPYLEWLRRVPAGRGLSEEIDAVMRTRSGPGAVDARRHYETNQHKVHAWAPGAPTRIR